MWFTILFFSWPIGLVLFYRTVKNPDGRRSRKIGLALLLLILPFPLLVLERHNLLEIEKDAKGQFISGADSLLLDSNSNYRILAANKSRLGTWSFEVFDDPVIVLKTDDSDDITLSITYDNGEIVLVEEGYSKSKNWVKK